MPERALFSDNRKRRMKMYRKALDQERTPLESLVPVNTYVDFAQKDGRLRSKWTKRNAQHLNSEFPG